VSDALKRIRVTPSPKVSVGLSVNGDWLELQMTSEEMTREELVEILSRYNRKKKFYRLKNGDFVNMEDEGMHALIELQKGLNLTSSQLKKETVEVPKYRALYLDGELHQSGVLPVHRNRAFRSLVRNMKTVEDNDFEIPPSLEPILREYQKRGFLWLKTLCHNGFGGILADDMGLGKTLQVIAFLVSELDDGTDLQEDTASQHRLRRSLIVCPASLVYNWKSEFERFAPQLSVKMVTGTAAERRAVIEQAGESDILLTSYDLLKRDLGCYEGVKFFCEVIDEAQYIKNHNTQAAKAVKQINASFHLALTGTPIENRLSELWSIFDYLMPGFLYGYQKFREEIEVPVLQHQDEEAMQRLQKMIRPFVLRRLKKEVLTDLPDKLEECIYAKMEGEQQSLYDAHVKRLQLLLDKNSEEEFNRSKIQILSELTKLRQICCDPALLFEGYQGDSSKTEVCVDLIKNAVSAGHKILLFSQFTSMLERLQERLTAEKISYYTLTGSTGKEKRRELVESFQQDETSVFCISLKAGGTGLNLTAADIVIHYDPWWNLAVQNQATDRAHRIGQENVVTVYKLITKGTIEENITKLQEKKHELADQVLGGAGLDGGSFTKEELLELLK
jgi:SNF2 family DNA or RNA helicase